MKENKEGIELMDYLNIFWKRKWLIIVPALLCMIVAGGLSFILPAKWEIDTIIQPSKFFIQTESGQFEEIVVVDPIQIAGQINQDTYNRMIAEELSIDIKDFPKLQAKNLKNTKLVQVFLVDSDVGRAKSVLTFLFSHIKKDLDEKADIEINNIDTKIKSNELEVLRTEEEIKILQKKLRITQIRKKEIDAEMSNIRKRIDSLESLQAANLEKKARTESETLALLLYSNEIQQSLRYYDELNELLSSKQLEEENINLEIKNGEKKIKQIENTIDNLKEMKGRIDYSQLIKEPTASVRPVSPRSVLNIFLAGLLAFAAFSLIAFFLEYKEQNISKKPKED